jgi:hypothetical protein
LQAALSRQRIAISLTSIDELPLFFAQFRFHPFGGPLEISVDASYVAEGFDDAPSIRMEGWGPDFAAGYGSKVAADAKKRAVENEDQIQSLVKFESGAAGVIEASRICAGRVFGIFFEISGTEGTIYKYRSLIVTSRDPGAPAVSYVNAFGTVNSN